MHSSSFQSRQNNKDDELQGHNLFPLVTAAYVVGRFGTDWAFVQIWFSE